MYYRLHKGKSVWFILVTLGKRWFSPRSIARLDKKGADLSPIVQVRRLFSAPKGASSGRPNRSSLLVASFGQVKAIYKLLGQMCIRFIQSMIHCCIGRRPWDL